LWLEGLPADKKNSFANLKISFEGTYIKPLYMKYRSAKDIFTRKQAIDERVDDYVAQIQRLARNIGADDRMIMYAIINGLRPNIAAYVTQRDPKTVAEMIDAARVAELTNPSVMELAGDLTDKLSHVQMEVRRLGQRLDRASTNAVATGKSRSPTPERKVTFATGGWLPGRGGGAGPARREQRGPPRQGLGHGRPFTAPSFRRPGQVLQEEQENREQCTRCGRQAHIHPQYCPAINQRCNFCFKIGHFRRVCRAAARAREQQQQ